MTNSAYFKSRHTNRLAIITLFTAIFHQQCTIPIDPESFEYKPSIVVDGFITNEIKQHTLQLKYSDPISLNFGEPIADAQVWVSINDQEVINYELAGFWGHYQSKYAFAAESGNSYRLHFILNDGREYESELVNYIDPVPIDSIYDRYAELAPDGSTSNEGGIQFFLDSYSENSNAQYFRYEWEEDYKIQTPYKASFIYKRSLGDIVPKTKPTNICYAHDVSKTILLGNNVSTNHRMVEFPIRFISGETDVLRNRYSILVKQYSIDANAYNFYKKFKQLNESGGSLFDKQAGPVPGNVKALDDPYEEIMGYFEVAGLSQKRVFFNYNDLDPIFTRPDYRTNCYMFPLEGSGPFSNPLDDVGRDFDVLGYSDGAPLLADKTCTDCTGSGTTTPPDFWTE